MNRAERARRDQKRHRSSEQKADRHKVAADMAQQVGRRDRQVERSSERLDPVSDGSRDVTIEESDSR